MEQQIAQQPIEVPEPSPCSESAFAEMLSHHYGDGIVYLCRGGARMIYQLAMQRGYVSDDGYLTRKGRALLTRFNYA